MFFLIRAIKTKRHDKTVITDRSLLPNTVLLLLLLLVVVVLGSGSEEKVAKIFPKIIQTVKKLIFSFPILLRSFCFSKYPESNKWEERKKKALWMSGVYPSVCFKSEGGVDLRFGSKVSYGLSQMPLQVIFMGGSFEYSNMIGWRFEGRGLYSGPCAESFTIFSSQTELSHWRGTGPCVKTGLYQQRQQLGCQIIKT